MLGVKNDRCQDYYIIVAFKVSVGNNMQQIVATLSATMDKKFVRISAT